MCLSLLRIHSFLCIIWNQICTFYFFPFYPNYGQQQHCTFLKELKDFKWPSSPRMAKQDRKTLIRYVVRVLFSFTVLFCQGSDSDYTSQRLFCGCEKHHIYELYPIVLVRVQVLLAVGRKASTSDIGLEHVGVQCDQEWVLRYPVILISVQSGFDKQLCAAAAGFWWTTGTRPA